MEYPLTVSYCTECGLPHEYCSFGPTLASCMRSLKTSNPELYAQLYPEGDESVVAAAAALEAADLEDDEETDLPKPKTSRTAKKYVRFAVRQKGKRQITEVVGLEAYDLVLKEVASNLAKKVGSGATVGTSPEGVKQVEVQGDISYELPKLLSDLYKIDPKLVRPMK